jgi:P27 family predicted phage terminase small subunit
MGNENSGRRPQSTALKLLRGNPGKRKPNEHEPRPPSGDVVKPEGLSAGGSRVWDELAPICLAMGTLTTADLRPFATLCELQSTLQIASAGKDAPGFAPFRMRPKDSSREDSPMVVVIDSVLKLERDTATALRHFYEVFGLTPSARARLSVPKKAEEPVSKWAGALK